VSRHEHPEPVPESRRVNPLAAEVRAAFAAAAPWSRTAPRPTKGTAKTVETNRNDPATLGLSENALAVRGKRCVRTPKR
jgi:hypothetical protein